jgi:hypothetical protein
MVDVNLIPMARLARKRRNTRLYVWAAFCGAYAMCLIAGAATWQALRCTEDRALHGQHVDLAQGLEQDYRNLLDLRKELGEMTASLDTTRAIHNQPDWSRLFLGLSDRLGDEIVLSHCRLVTVTGDNRPVSEHWETVLPSRPLGALLTECRHKLLLTGFGKNQESVSRFILRLEETGIFDVVRLVNSSRQSFLEKEAVAFSVECCLEGSG